MADKDIKTRLVGKSFGKTILQLVVASIFVGAVLSFIGLSPKEFWRGVFRNIQNLLGSLGENVGEILATLGAYLVIGAAIVVPIWLIARLLSRK